MHLQCHSAHKSPDPCTAPVHEQSSIYLQACPPMDTMHGAGQTWHCPPRHQCLHEAAVQELCACNGQTLSAACLQPLRHTLSQASGIWAKHACYPGCMCTLLRSVTLCMSPSVSAAGSAPEPASVNHSPAAPQVFGRAAFEHARHWFRYMLITNEQSAKDKPKNVRFAAVLPNGVEHTRDITARDGCSADAMRCATPAQGCPPRQGSCTQVLKFLFALPRGVDTPLMNQMMGLVMVYIDLLGGYKLGPEQRKRSEKVRPPALPARLQHRGCAVPVPGLCSSPTPRPRAACQPARCCCPEVSAAAPAGHKWRPALAA